MSQIYFYACVALMLILSFFLMLLMCAVLLIKQLKTQCNPQLHHEV